MRGMRHFASSLWLALALVLGQHAALLHDFGHALKRIQSSTQQDQHPGSDTCDKCSLYAPFTGAAGAYVAAVALAPAAFVAALFAFTPAPSRTVVSSRSRAPPRIS